jgi:hypothetical protein
MSATPEINRENAQHSTGPRTEAGERRSCLNAMKHGATGQLVVSPKEDLEFYESHLKTFQDKCQPQGAIEENLVQALADVSWRINRVVLLESNLLSISYSLRDLVAGLLDQAKALASLSMHSQRLSRQFERTVALLRELQKARHAKEKLDLEALVKVIEMQEAKGKPYDPSADGFLFSQIQINEAKRARNREHLILKASFYEAELAAA